MPADVVSLRSLAAALAGRRGAILSLDLGAKRIGVAASDAERSLVVPVTVIARRKFTLDAEAILRLAADREAVAIIIGLPLNMDGSEGPRAQSARSFARHFSLKAPIPLAFVDERLSTIEAADILTRAGVSARRQRELIDAAAAMVILEDAIATLTLSS